VIVVTVVVFWSVALVCSRWDATWTLLWCGMSQVSGWNTPNERHVCC
jgi:hypothetical protein